MTNDIYCISQETPKYDKLIDYRFMTVIKDQRLVFAFKGRDGTVEEAPTTNSERQ